MQTHATSSPEWYQKLQARGKWQPRSNVQKTLRFTCISEEQARLVVDKVAQVTNVKGPKKAFQLLLALCETKYTELNGAKEVRFDLYIAPDTYVGHYEYTLCPSFVRD